MRLALPDYRFGGGSLTLLPHGHAGVHLFDKSIWPHLWQRAAHHGATQAHLLAAIPVSAGPVPGPAPRIRLLVNGPAVAERCRTRAARSRARDLLLRGIF